MIKVNYWQDYLRIHPEFTGCLIDRHNNKYLYKNGKLHGEDSPALEFVSGYKAWYKKGVWHRENGPAVEWVNGEKTWYLSGVRLTEQEWKVETRRMKLKLL